jgi:hypothetical protein
MKYIKHFSLLFVLIAFIQCRSFRNDDIENFKIVKGNVVDKFSLPLPGTFIEVKGTENHTSADWEGNFEIMVKEGDILIASFVTEGRTMVKIDSKNYYEIVILPNYVKESKKSKRQRKRERRNGQFRGEEEF